MGYLQEYPRFGIINTSTKETAATINSKKANIEWAIKNGKKFVFSRIDGLGKRVYFVTNDDRSMDAGMTLEWKA